MYKENHWMCPKNTIKKNCVDGRFKMSANASQFTKGKIF